MTLPTQSMAHTTPTIYSVSVSLCLDIFIKVMNWHASTLPEIHRDNRLANKGIAMT